MSLLSPFVNSLPVAAVFVLGSLAVIWKGSEWLEHSAANLSLYYGLPPVVHGAIVVAVGSSFPELSSAVIATWLHGEFGLGVGAIVGSAIFNILVIPALSSLAVDHRVEANRDIVFKEAQFYMLSVAVVLITFSLAVIYNGAPGEFKGVVTPALALLPIALYVLYIFIQYQDTSDYDAEAPPASLNVGKQWALLAVSLLTIALAVEALVSGITYTAARFSPDLLWVWGMTVIAAGTSLPDALVSIRAAKAGESATSLANVLGSNVFDLLVAVPAGILVAAAVGNAVVIDFAIAVPMMTALTVATVFLFTLLRTDLHLTNREAYFLLGAYAVFVAWLFLGIFGVSPIPVPVSS
ncbi:sodium:calcium antiporter [Halorubellus litoreus]|uniref:Sodium:calcium antiporter n=1 Tax=Halorubellus litoreus TaxID=755308 RepID=A0ABD5VG11_9EURY